MLEVSVDQAEKVVSTGDWRIITCPFPDLATEKSEKSRRVLVRRKLWQNCWRRMVKSIFWNSPAIPAAGLS